MVVTLTALHRYPVKSCRGESLTDATVEPWGLVDDRRWMVVDDEGAALTAREANRLVLVRPQLTDAGVRLHAPGAEPIDVARPDGSQQVPVNLWSSHLTAAPTGPEVSRWISSRIGRSARLVWLDDPTRRPTDQRFSEPDDRVSLADGYPLLLTSETSLAALDDVVPMARFRPNVVVAGAEAWAEDDWRRIRIGEVMFRAVKGCARCVLTTVDPETAERGREPIATLARSRRWDGKTWFGVNLVPDLPAGPDDAGLGPPRIAVGDQVEVLEQVAPGAGPLRPRR